MWILSGCKGTPQNAAPEKTPPTPVEPAPSIDPPLLQNMLEQAEAAIARDQLSYPLRGSAYEIYTKILDLEPGQDDAMRGLEHLVERYIALAMRSLEMNQFATARSMLSRARLINPDHPSIQATDEQMRLLSAADRILLKLTQDELNTTGEATNAALKSLARIPGGNDCRFTIYAKNDAQGRWLYQRLTEYMQNTRLRAQIRIRLPAAVERVCFSS